MAQGSLTNGAADWSQMALRTPENDEEDLETEEIFAVRDDEGWNADKMTAKVPPTYDGNSSLFAYEEHVQEWLSIAQVDQDKIGPLLRYRLRGNAMTVKNS